jgi:hypothetical protein
MSLNHQEFTNAGRDNLGRANNGEKLIIPYVAIGSGHANGPRELWPLEDLIERQLVATITQKKDLGDGILLIDVAFNSSVATERFELREVGVVAHIEGETPKLYSVANAFDTGVDQVDPDLESIHAFKIKVVIDRATDVEIVIGESRDIMAENIGLDTVGPGWFEEKIANTLRFKRIKAGSGIMLEDEPGVITVHGSRGMLEQDLTLYVRHNPDPDDPTQFATLPAALASIQDIAIPKNRFLTIQHDPGVWVYTQPVVISHSNALQIRILGAPPLLFKTDSGATNQGNLINAGAGIRAFTIALTAGEVAQCSVNDGAAFLGTGGQSLASNYHLYSHAGRISALGANTITFETRMPNNAAWGSSFRRGDLIKYQTLLQFNNSTGLIIDEGTQLGLLNNLFIRGNRTIGNNGIVPKASAGVRLGNRMAIYEFDDNIYLVDMVSYIVGDRTFCSGALTNCVWLGKGAQAQFGDSVFSGAGSTVIGANGEFSFRRCYIHNAAIDGVEIAATTSEMDDCLVARTGTGLWSHEGASLGANTSVFFENTDLDAYALNLSYISIHSFYADSPGNQGVSPNLGVIGNVGSVIIGPSRIGARPNRDIPSGW